MSKIHRVELCAMTNSKHVLAVGLTAAALVVVLPFLQGALLLVVPEFASLVVRAGPAPVLAAWFGPVVPIIAVALATAAFVVSWKHKSFLVAGLLAASGIIFMVASVIATEYFAVIMVPGPILGVIFGLWILGLGLAKGIRTAKTAVITAS
jgi:hypothetical protein